MITFYVTTKYDQLLYGFEALNLMSKPKLPFQYLETFFNSYMQQSKLPAI